MLYLISSCAILWLLMGWLTYSKRLNSAQHIILLKDEMLSICDTPIARLFPALGCKIPLSSVERIEATPTHVILHQATSSVDIFINHRFINDILAHLSTLLPEIEAIDKRPIGG